MHLNQFRLDQSLYSLYLSALEIYLKRNCPKLRVSKEEETYSFREEYVGSMKVGYKLLWPAFGDVCACLVHPGKGARQPHAL